MSGHQYSSEQFHPFYIVVKIEGYNRRLKVMQTLRGIGEEDNLVTARNKTIKFSTNKPIIERRQLPNFPWTWKLIDGELNSQSAQSAIIEALDAHLRGKTPPTADCMLLRATALISDHESFKIIM